MDGALVDVGVLGAGVAGGVTATGGAVVVGGVVGVAACGAAWARGFECRAADAGA